MTPTQIYLIRHGESTWNRIGRVQGWSDPALSALGMQQARAVARRMGEIRPQRLYASPLLRAYQTAQAISRRMKLPIQPVDEFREVGLGAWEGVPVKWLRRRHRAMYETWLRTPSKASIPNGERIPAFHRRVSAAFSAVLDDTPPGSTIAIVTHGGVIRMILAKVLGIPFDPLMHRISLGNTSI